VTIYNKSINASYLQSFLRIDRVSALNRENLCFSVLDQRVIKTDCLFIDQNQVNLRVWNATRLNDVFYGRLFGEQPLDYCPAGF
jgi:hypothetical protein